MRYERHFSTRSTPQSDPIPDRKTEMVKGDAGGYVFPVDDWTRLDRFLVLGAEGGTYYVGERDLTVQNAQAVMRCLKADGKRTVERIREISQAGRAAKNDPALFALAMCAGKGDKDTRTLALASLPDIARTGTHLFQFLNYVQAFRGWGKMLRQGVARWYNEKPEKDLAYQVVKYRQRHGWMHQDVLRKAHPSPATDTHGATFGWITGKPYDSRYLPELIDAFTEIQSAMVEEQILATLERYPELPWETVPTQFLASPDVWRMLLPRLPLTAMIRNLGRMTANGLLKPMSEETGTVTCRIVDENALRKARVHPVQVLTALTTYQSGSGARGKLTWKPVREIVDALDAAFYTSFGNVQPTGKRTMLALDVSGSMDDGEICGVPGLTPRIGAAAMALVTAAVEDKYVTTIFSQAGEREMVGTNTLGRFWNAGISAWDVSPRQRLDDVVTRMATLRTRFSGTDCALPILYALRENMAIDVFVVYTDSEIWAGNVHPVQALQEYRRRTGIPAKLVVVGMVSNGFSIADPQDGGMLDVVGFDTAAPNLISDFARSNPEGG